jgi:hypothetical protein
MTTLLDTSVIVRYLIDDPPEQAARAAELLDTALAKIRDVANFCGWTHRGFCKSTWHMIQ